MVSDQYLKDATSYAHDLLEYDKFRSFRVKG